MKVLVTGSRGFVGKNLCIRLKELKKYQILEFSRENQPSDLVKLVEEADFVFHLAGVNRPENESDFKKGNTDLTQDICEILRAGGKKTPVVYSSSIQAEKPNAYGISKLEAEQHLLNLSKLMPVYIYRLPNVFGKWSRPNYNSVVATFCNNLSQELPITINDPSTMLNLLYVDDLVNKFIECLEGNRSGVQYPVAGPIYSISLGDLAKQLTAIKESRKSLVTENVGTGLVRALHATYLSFLRPEQFVYALTRHEDTRGTFVEMLKTKEAGQFSFFTAYPGITRGGHYHHTKTEKFLVLQGKARYRFRHIVTNEFFELDVDAKESKVVETVPGWSHDISNIGNEVLIVMLWANEIFDRTKPDTIAHGV